MWWFKKLTVPASNETKQIEDPTMTLITHYHGLNDKLSARLDKLCEKKFEHDDRMYWVWPFDLDMFAANWGKHFMYHPGGFDGNRIIFVTDKLTFGQC